MDSKDYSEDDEDEQYFTEEHDKAIEEYIKSDESEEEKRQWLYREYIGPAFDELVDKIVNTYNFNDLENVEEKKEECKAWLMTIIDKYDPEANTKAFSYFTVVVKNWFNQEIKEQSKKKKRETDFEDVPRSFEKDYLTTYNEFDKNIEKKEFFEYLFKEIKRWSESKRIQKNLGKNDKKVVDAIIELFENSEEIDVFSKKAIYFYIRRMTDLNTKQVSRSLKKLKKRYYKVFKRKWKEDRIGDELK